jgi:hypothetical protein
MSKKTIGELVEDICNTGIQYDEIYKHYKGKFYRVDDIVIDCNSNEPLVIYKEMINVGGKMIEASNPISFCRRATEWNEIVDGHRRFSLMVPVVEYLTEDELVSRY